MPNHVTHVMTIIAPDEETLQRVRDAMRGPESEDGERRIFDFNQFIKMPPALMDAVSDGYASQANRQRGRILRGEDVRVSDAGSIYSDDHRRWREAKNNVFRYLYADWYAWSYDN